MESFMLMPTLYAAPLAAILVYGFFISCWGWGYLQIFLSQSKGKNEATFDLLSGVFVNLAIAYLWWWVGLPLLTAIALSSGAGLILGIFFRYDKKWPLDYHLSLVGLCLMCLLVRYIPFMDDEFNLWMSGPIRMLKENTLITTDLSTSHRDGGC